MRARTLLVTLGAVLWWIVPSVLVAEIGLVAARHALPPEMLAATSDVVGNSLQTLGSIYAVLLAFVVFVVWTQFNDARSYVEREANELVDLFRTSRGLADPARAEVQRGVREYAAHVLGDEWAAMRAAGRGNGNHHAGFEAGAAIVDRIWQALQVCPAEDSCQEAMFSEALAHFNGFSDARTNRLTASTLKIPLALHVLLYMGALFTVGMMYLFAVADLGLHMVITGAMAGALSHILFVIHDLDTPFGGTFQVPRGAFEHVRDYVSDGA